MNEFYDETIVKVNDNNAQIDENLITKFNIIDLYGKETLEDIQEKISKATGLAFVTVDYKGEPITKMTSFTKFCNEIRKSDEGACGCKASDAFGGIQAAVTQKICVYFCPCGLFEIAIPIIVRGHYLGAFIGGQVRCMDAPSGLSKLENVIGNSKKYKEDKRMQELFNSTPIYKYQKFLGVAELVVLIINQLGEKEAYRLMQKNSLKNELEQLKDHTKQLKIENNLNNYVVENFEINKKSSKSDMNQFEQLFLIIKEKDFKKVYYEIPKIINLIYLDKKEDKNSLKEYFTNLGQHVINSVEILDGELKKINELFPIDEFSISDKKFFEFWLFKVMNYVFQQNSIKKYPLLEKVFDYIEKHIEEEIGLNEIINNCLVSQGYLSRIFKRQFNVSVMEYLHMRKMYMAKSYFCFTNLSITDVAFKLGYNESSYFSKVFKKYENITVYQYKKIL
jgi:ligand-binding sensor protein/AraC-like DNA-binding protein